MSLLDDLLADRELEVGGKAEPKPMGPMDAPQAAPTGVTAGSGDETPLTEAQPEEPEDLEPTHSKRLITGSLARALNRKPSRPPQPSLDDLIADRDIEVTTGKAPEPREFVMDEDEAEPVDITDALLEERGDATYQSDQPLQLQDPKATNLSTQAARNTHKRTEGMAGLGRPLLIALNAEEHAIVGQARRVFGLPHNKDTLDNTYTNMLRDWAGPYAENRAVSPLIEAAGLGLSIFAVPSTYLTAGVSRISKIGEVAALSKYGENVAINLAKERVAAKVGGEVTEEVRNKLLREESDRVRTELAKHFGEMTKATKDVAIGKDIVALKSDVFDRGGLKFFGKTILGGNELAESVKRTGMDKIAEIPGKMVNKVGELPTIRKLQTVADEATKPVQETLGKWYQNTKDTLWELLVPQYSADKKIVDLWQDTQRESRTAYDRFYEHTKGWFDKYGVKSKKQKEDFFNSINDAFGDKELLGIVEAKSKDPKVQKAIDRWLGQGEFQGRRPVTDKLARYAGLAEEGEKVNWIPGINEKYADKIPGLQLGAVDGPSSRSFNLERDYSKDVKYLQDPVQAIAMRRTQAYMANLQDKMYANIVNKKLGDMKPFKSIEEAAAQGYVPFIKPYQQKFMSELSGAPELSTEARGLYVKKEFYQAYRTMVTNPESRMSNAALNIYKMIEKPTNLWKQHITATSPAFHVRNAGSNIVFNAMSIGGHAFDPNLHKIATEMVTGTNLDRIVTTKLGEKLPIKGFIAEAKKEGLMDAGHFADVAGDLLEGDARTLWKFSWDRLNPFSKEFAPSAFGRKVGGVIEDQAKLVNYMHWRIKGLSPKVAAMEAREALFDYGAITDFERWAKLAIPFYTFGRKNLEKQVKMFAHRPGVITGQLKAFEQLGPTDSEWKNSPEFFKSKFALKLGNLISTGYGLPIEDVLQMADPGLNTLTRLNPIIKYPMERIAKQDFHSGRALLEIQSAKEWGWAFRWAHNKDTPAPLKEVGKAITSALGLKRDPSMPNKIIGDYERIHLLRNMFTSRYMSTMALMDDTQKKGMEKAIQLMTGIVRIKPNAEIANSNFKKKEGQRLKEEAAKHGLKFLDLVQPVTEDSEDLGASFKELRQSEDLLESEQTAKDIRQQLRTEYK